MIDNQNIIPSGFPPKKRPIDPDKGREKGSLSPQYKVSVEKSATLAASALSPSTKLIQKKPSHLSIDSGVSFNSILSPTTPTDWIEHIIRTPRSMNSPEPDAHDETEELKSSFSLKIENTSQPSRPVQKAHFVKGENNTYHKLGNFSEKGSFGSLKAKRKTNRQLLRPPTTNLVSPGPSINLMSPVFQGRQAQFYKIDDVALGEGNLIQIKTNWGSLYAKVERPVVSAPAGREENPEAILLKWLNKPSVQNLIKEELRKKERLFYDANDIANALRIFQENHFNWGELKQKYREGNLLDDNYPSIVDFYDYSKVIMQVIHDLRSAYNDYIIERLRENFKRDSKLAGFVLKANDFGSKSPGSDADLGFEFSPEFDDESFGIKFRKSSVTPADLHLRQIDAVIGFNREFSRIWNGHPSAIIFDTNAYTMQYIRNAKNSEIEKDHNQYQSESALLMRRKLDPHGWDHFKKAVLKGVSGTARENEVINKFKKVENRYVKLENALLIKTLKVACHPQTDSATVEERWMKTIEDIEKGLSQDPFLQEKVRTIVGRIREKNGNIDIWSSNLLHEEMKQKCVHLEEIRALFIHEYEALKWIENPEDFLKKFNQTIDNGIQRFQSVLDGTPDAQIKVHIQNYIHALNKMKLKEQEAEFGHRVFLERAIYEDRISELETDLIKMETLKALYGKQNDRHKEKITDLEKGITTPSIILARYSELLDEWPEAIRLKMSIDEQRELRTYQQKLELLESLRKEKQKFEAIHSIHEASSKVKEISYILDKLLLNIQYYNTQGLYFAQEPLMTEGGFATVVKGMQDGSLEPLTINQSVQAFHEVTGYHYNHQHAHGMKPDSYSKIVEVSKYTDRALVILGNINEKAREFGINAPSIDKVQKLHNFIKHALVLRKSAKDTREKELEIENEWRKLGFSNHFGNNGLEVINQIMADVSVSLEIWYDLLPESIQNSLFKT